MLSLFLLASLATASAAEHRLAVGVGGHASTGLRTQLPVVGIEGSLGWTLQGERSGLRVELHDVVGWTNNGAANLPGVRLGWTALWGDGGVHPYTVVGLGGYLTDALPALPILWLEGGVELAGERTFLQLGPDVYGLPPFFVGGGLHATAGVRL